MTPLLSVLSTLIVIVIHHGPIFPPVPSFFSKRSAEKQKTGIKKIFTDLDQHGISIVTLMLEA